MTEEALQDILHYFDHPVRIQPGFKANGIGHPIEQTMGTAFIKKNDRHEHTKISDAEVLILGAPNARFTAEIRNHLYPMSRMELSPGIFDLGDFRNGKTSEDTLTGWQDVLLELGKTGKVLVVIGRDPEGLGHTLQALSRMEHPINLAVVSPDIHLDTEQGDLKASYLSRALTDTDSNVFDYVHLAHQSYFTDPDALELLEKMHFSQMRLGELRTDIREAEPHLRNSDMLAFSMAAVRHADAPGTRLNSANGLYAEEACQLSKYAGLSDKLNVIQLFDLPDTKEISPVTANLTAQIIWHFIQGVGQRKKDYPFAPITSYSKYIVNIPGADHEINFYRSQHSDRWWMEVPYPDSRYPRSLYVACTPKDYQLACNGEIPDRWLKNYQRIC